MNQQVEIRKANMKDADTISSLIHQLADEIGFKSPITPQYAREYLRSRSCAILLAFRSRKPVGLLSYSIRPCLFHAAPSCVIEDLVVTSESRRLGVGSTLVEQATRIAARANCAEISVSTERNNSKAIGLYKQQGLTDESLFLERHL